mmetsp:Transcript_26105/g.46426  ORF Transcript_26105/g.46426 Transcript_26105/m.46426 type:complete len:166 (-) Transcript_26105:151-648(-)
MAAFKALGAGFVGALALVFGKGTYEAFHERQALSALQVELSFHKRELARLEKDVSSNKTLVANLEEQQKSSGFELAGLEKELQVARKKVSDLEAQHAAKLAAAAAAKELLRDNSSLIVDLGKLQEAKHGKVTELSSQVEAQAQTVAKADNAANPLNHPLVKKFFG